MQDIARDTLIKASQGDMKAFEHIYRVSSGFVYSVALRVISHKDDADDVTQEVFVKVHKYLKTFKFRSSFKTWLYRITANTAINAYRKKAKDLSRSTDFDIAIQAVGTPDQKQEIAEKIDTQKCVQLLLERLNPDQRACVVMREIEGLSYQEIASALQININTVRSRLKRARMALLALRKREVIGYEV